MSEKSTAAKATAISRTPPPDVREREELMASPVFVSESESPEESVPAVTHTRSSRHRPRRKAEHPVAGEHTTRDDYDMACAPDDMVDVRFRFPQVTVAGRARAVVRQASTSAGVGSLALFFHAASPVEIAPDIMTSFHLEVDGVTYKCLHVGCDVPINAAWRVMAFVVEP